MKEFLFRPSRSEPRNIKVSDSAVSDSEIAVFEEQPKGGLLLKSDKGLVLARLQWNGSKYVGMDSYGYSELVPSQPIQTPPVDRNIKLHGEVSEKTDVIFNMRYDLSQEVQKSSKDLDTAVAIICCDRPNYFKEVIKALAPQIQDYPVYLFADFPPSEDENVRNQQISLAKSLIPHIVVVKRDRNIGCGLNIIDARDQLFTNFGYSKVFLFEDDMVPDDNYVETCVKMLEDLPYSNVGAVQGWSRCFLTEGQKKVKNTEVFATFENAWGYLMTKECWDAIRPQMIEYSNFLTSTVYGKRDNMKISRWQHQFKQRNFHPRGDNPFPMDNVSKVYEQNTLDNLPTGQDGTTYLLMRDAGFVRVATTVNRGKYIGKTGIHSTPEIFNKSRFEDVILHKFKTPKTFKPRNKGRI